MEERNVKRQIIISSILVAVIGIVLVLISGVFYSSMKGAQEKDAQKYMHEIVSQYKNIITTQIEGDLQTLSALSTFFGQDDGMDLSVIVSRVEAESSSDFSRMGVVSPGFTGYFIDTDGKRYDGVDVSEETFLQQAMAGQAAVSDIMKDKLTGQPIICYGVPVMHHGEIIGAITAARLVSNFSEIISQEIFDGAAFIHIVDREGNFIIRSDHAVIPHDLNNIFESGDIPSDIRDAVLSEIGQEDNVFATFHYQGNAYWVTFIPIGINDWQIFCLVPQSFLNHNFDSLLFVFVCVMVCIFALFSILCLYIYSILRKEQRTLQFFAYKDMLTGADNRNRFVIDLPALLQQPWDHAMILMNVSGFKFVNEFYGFQQGNQLLQHISAVLQANVGQGEHFFRDNADHFGLLLRYEDQEQLISRIRKIQHEINEYTISPNQGYSINCTFGVSIIPAYTDKARAIPAPDAVLNGALLALNSVNGNTTNPIAFDDEILHEKARRKTEIASRMYAALENGEFHMYLQPKYRLEGRTLHSAEALVRWVMEDGSIRYPDEFIPAFEENGFITELDMFMLESACKRIAYWIRQGYPVVPISVNQSRIFFYDENYIGKIRQIVDRYHIDPSLIILEVTESVAMSNLAQVKREINKLHHMGFSISMDDFGSGYSSLNTLKDLDITELKLDKEFLSEQSTSPRGKLVIESMVHLARALSITTVAEGIENEEQLAFLRSIHCDIGQGYFFAKPVPIEQFEQNILKNGI